MVTFKKPIGSVSVSGHKFVGAPVPCGVVITRKEYVEALSSDVEYLNSRDATIMGSRNGHAPLYLWYTLTKKGYEGMRKDVEKCLRNAHLLKVRLSKISSSFLNLCCFCKLYAMQSEMLIHNNSFTDICICAAFFGMLPSLIVLCRPCWRRWASRPC